MPLRILVISSILFATTAFARFEDPGPLCDATPSSNIESINAIVALQEPIMESNCPNEGRMRTLCGYIGNKAKDTTPNTDYTFFFQRVVYDAACVDYTNDSDEEVAQKVRTMWARFGNALRCGPMGVPATGTPLRYAIHTMFNEFITEALSMWRLDLNQVENGMTMLDFIDDRISHSSGVLKTNLETYRRSFVEMGAKKRSQL